ncbi:GWxTD domain-containing protein [bacterium]|nr:GWxTD domain-containing protein [bacterium]
MHSKKSHGAVALLIAGSVMMLSFVTGSRPGAAAPQTRATGQMKTVETPQSMIERGIRLALQDSVSSATDLIYNGLNRLGNNPYANDLFARMKDILATEELRMFSSSPNKGGALLLFWQRRDPTPATPENERIVEHFTRIEEARKQFHSAVPRGYDDRGMIYVRYGEPSDRMIAESNNYGPPNECWVYNNLGEEVVFDFVKSGAHYELLSSLRDVVNKGDEEDSMRLLGLFVEDRIGHSSVYASGATTVGTFLEAEDFFSSRIKAVAMRIPMSVSNLQRMVEPLHAEVTFARFRQNSMTRVELYISIPYRGLEPLQDDPESAKNPRIPVRISYAIRDSAGAVKYQYDYPGLISTPDKKTKKEGHFEFQLNCTIPEGAYRIAIEFQNPTSMRSTEKLLDVRGLAAGNGEPVLSDPQLSEKIIETNGDPRYASVAKGDLYVNPFPRAVIDRKARLLVYGEAYGITPDADDRADITASWEIFPGKSKKSVAAAENVLAGRDTYAHTFRRLGDTCDNQFYFTLPVKDLKEGDYRLVLTVRDAASGREAVSEVPFSVAK